MPSQAFIALAVTILESLQMSQRVHCLACMCALVLVARTTAAQSSVPDSILGSPRWAIEVPIVSGYAASLLRFGSGTSAWLVNSHWNGGVQSETTVTPVASIDEDASFFDVSLSIGRRTYRGTGSARSFLGLGLTGGIAGRDGNNLDENRWSAGAYGEIGAAYFVNRHLSLGGSGTANLSRTHQTFEQNVGGQVSHGDRQSWTISGPNLRLMVSVLF